jgi:hypothetical protein
MIDPRRVRLRKHGGWWVLSYGFWGDCTCSYRSWQEAVWDFPHAIAVTEDQ